MTPAVAMGLGVHDAGINRAGTEGRTHWWPPCFLAFQVLLGAALAGRGSGTLSTVHALATFGATMYFAFRAPMQWTTAAAAYLVASEVLWRMTAASVPWEGAKYGAALALLVAVWRIRSRARAPVLPVLYFAALLPSVLVLLDAPKLGGPQVTGMLSGNLSGPLMLAVAVWSLSGTAFDEADTDRVLMALGGPMVTIGVVTLIRTVTTVDLTFTRASNFATSGGFGPNQVSSALGLGVLMALMVALRSRPSSLRAWVSLGLTLFCGVQAAMTFSRGGIYGAGIGIGAMLVSMLRNPSRAMRPILVALPALLLGGAVVLPQVDDVTGGALVARFRDREATGRDEIVAEDLRIWGEHPVFGVGPGAAIELRRTESSMAHTEYSRLLAEHGVFGLAAIGLLAAMSAGVLRRGLRSADAAGNIAMVAWSLTSMAHAGMRIAVFGFVFGLAHARFAEARATAVASRRGRDLPARAPRVPPPRRRVS